MSKLIYAKSKSGFEVAFPDRSIAGPIYRSIVFTEDGYLWTHGQYFNIFTPDTLLIKSATVAANIVTLTDANDKTVTFDRGVYNLAGTTPISVTGSNGNLTISHSTSGVTGTTYGNGGADTINVPTIVFNTTGHLITGTTHTAVTVSNVKSNLVTTTGDQYITFAAASATGNSQLNKASALKYNPGTGVLSAGTYVGALTNALTITLNNSAITYNNSVARTYTFYAPVTGGTANQILQSNGNAAPSWVTLSGVTSGSTYTEIPSAKAVFEAISTGIATNDAMIYKGIWATAATYPAADRGWTFKLSFSADNFGGAGGPKVEAGDTIICTENGTAAGTHAAVGSKWSVIQTNIESSTVGLQLMTLVNAAPAGAQFIKVDGSTVSYRTAADVKTDIGLSVVENTKLSTWAGSSSITTLGTIGTGTWNASTIAVNKGGTGTTSLTTNAVLIGNNTSAINTVINSTAVKKFLTQTSSGVPTWETLGITDVPSGNLTVSNGGNITLAISAGTGTDALLKALTITAGWTGQLAVTSGGTGLSTIPINSMLYASTANTLSALSPGTNGYILRSVEGVPTWGAEIDTHHVSKLVVTTSTTGKTDINAGNTNLYLNLIENNAVRSTAKITGTGGTTVSSSGGNITINSTDTNTWRDVFTYDLSSSTATSIVQATLKFGQEFAWTDGELKLGWAEVSTDGLTITYTV